MNYMKTIRDDLFSKMRNDFRESAAFRYLASIIFANQKINNWLYFILKFNRYEMLQNHKNDYARTVNRK